MTVPLHKRTADLTGQKFGHLAVVSFAGYLGKLSRAHWTCLCDCGALKIARACSLINGVLFGCNDCGPRRAASLRKKLQPGLAVFRSLVSSYRVGANRRGILFALSEPECRQLFIAVCWYCGCAPGRVKRTKSRFKSETFVYNGIDRLNSSCGYESGNVVTCCPICNRAKSDLSLDEFLAWVDRIGRRPLPCVKVAA